MERYNYISYLIDGTKIENYEFAEDLDDLYYKLYSRGEYLDKVIEKKQILNMKVKLKSHELSDFCRQLGTMLKSGVSVTQALKIIEETCVLKKEIKLIYHQLSIDVNTGIALSNAMLRTSAFPYLLVNIIKSSEENATIDSVLLKMAKYYDNDTKIGSKIKGAMIYPTMLLCVTIIAIIAIFNFILPQFLGILEGLTELPLLTKIVMKISSIFVSYGIFIIIGIVGFIVFCMMLKQVPSVKYKIDKLKLKLPYVKGLLSNIYTYRFASTLSSMYFGGISIVYGVNLSATTINNKYLENQLILTVDNLAKGSSLSEALSPVDGLHKKLAASLRVGEETGQLDELLASLAESLEIEANNSIDKLISLLEPITIVFLGITILPIVLSVILPMLKMYSSIGV